MELDPSPGLLRWAAESGAHWVGLQQSLQPAKVAWLEGQIGELAHSKLTAATADGTDRVLQDKLAMLEVEGLGVAKWFCEVYCRSVHIYSVYYIYKKGYEIPRKGKTHKDR